MLNYVILGALFFALIPGILVTLPRGGAKYTVGLVHAVVFVLAYMVLKKYGLVTCCDLVFLDKEGFKGGGSVVINECKNPSNCYKWGGKGWGGYTCQCSNKSGWHNI